MEQVSMEQVARAAARMAAVGAMLDALKEHTRQLQVEARAAQEHSLAVKAGAILRGASGLDHLIADGAEIAAQAVADHLLAERAASREGSRLTTADLPPEMQA